MYAVICTPAGLPSRILKNVETNMPATGLDRHEAFQVAEHYLCSARAANYCIVKRAELRFRTSGLSLTLARQAGCEVKIFQQLEVWFDGQIETVVEIIEFRSVK